MSTKQNKAMVRKLLEQGFAQGKMSVIDELLAQDFVEHQELPVAGPGDREGVKQFITMAHSAFPDFTARIDDIIAEDDKVVARTTFSGTHKGDFMGIPPTGNRISFQVIDILRFVDGKIVEHWGVDDNMTMMQQLGIVPATMGAVG
jgi:steroid delta-isomerase-like uncharacterized protein